MRRGLVLAGGGIRVAWQAGALAALHEAGLRFAHGDGTSGGIFNLGMLLSGQQPDEMVQRWRDLDVRTFVSPLPLRSYLRSPTDWVAFGSARGVREKVLPELGIDLGAVRSAHAMTGSFNVADFTAKRCVPIPHTEIDLDRLVAGVSLAGVMPAIEHQGRVWTDAVWIQDANLMETVRRGCNELWVLWCIGNTPRWGAGALEQYVHMIELSATGALLSEFDLIADLNRRRAAGQAVLGSLESVVVHVVRPALPLPLDPELVSGRIDTKALIAMGYRDACRYLTEAGPQGTPLTEAATSTPARSLGCRLVVGASSDEEADVSSYTLVFELDDLEGLQGGHGGRFPVVGWLHHRTLGYRLLAGGFATLRGAGDDRRLTVTADVRLPTRHHQFQVAIPLARRRWRGARCQRWTVTDDEDNPIACGVSRVSLRRSLRALASFEPTGAPNLKARARAVRLAARMATNAGTEAGSADADQAHLTRSGPRKRDNR